MKADLRTEIERAYSKVARIYDLWSRLTETKALAKALELAKVEDGRRVLEVAVGTGLLMEKILELNPGGGNEGLDISGAMLNQARTRLKHFKNINLIRGEASELPYDDYVFDILINNFMLDLLPQQDFPQVLAEFRRVLKPGGRLVIATMTHGREWFSKLWDIIAKKAPSLLTGCRPVDLESEISKAGFGIEEKKYITQNTFPSLVICAGKKR